MIKGQTDDPKTSHELGQLLQGLSCHVNVIPLNPTNNFNGKPTSKSGVDEFIKILGTYGISATPRTRRGKYGNKVFNFLDLYFNHFTDRFKILGIDIDAGCGQLKADLLNKK